MIEVVAGLISHEGEFLCVQRGLGKHAYTSYKFEFPGGKVEPGESHQSALIREIQEELGMEIEVQALLGTITHAYPDFTIRMHGYLCTCESRDLVLHEHIQALWCLPESMHDLDWAAADVPLVQNLMDKA